MKASPFSIAGSVETYDSDAVLFEISARIMRQVVRNNSECQRARAATDGSLLALDDRARRDQRIAQPLMIVLEVVIGRDGYAARPVPNTAVVWNVAAR